MPENTPDAFVIPEDLTGLSTEELDAALDAARDEQAAIRETPPADMTDEQLDRLEALGAFAESYVTETARRAEVAAEREQRAAAAAERFDAATASPEEGDGEGDGSDDGDDSGEEGDGAEEGDEGAEQPQSVAA